MDKSKRFFYPFLPWFWLSGMYCERDHDLPQPCSTSGQLAECGQKGHFVWPNAPLPQKKLDTPFLSCTKICKMNICQSVHWLLIQSQQSWQVFNGVNLFPQVLQ